MQHYDVLPIQCAGYQPEISEHDDLSHHYLNLYAQLIIYIRQPIDLATRTNH